MYELSRHRYCELKHFCLQYPEWKYVLEVLEKEEYPVSKIATLRADYKTAMKLIEMTASDTDEKMRDYIFKSVTEDVSFSRINPPCDKGLFDVYRMKFFWLLDKYKGF